MSEMKDSADRSADAYVADRLSRADKTRTIQNEIDSTHALPGGRNNPVHSEVPGMKAEDANHRAMAKHSADYISAVGSKDRAKMESARAGFHAVKSASRGAPKNLEAPCSGAGCTKMAAPTKSTCERGDCGTSLSKNVNRPRG
jgi:hypothetical protein